MKIKQAAPPRVSDYTTFNGQLLKDVSPQNRRAISQMHADRAMKITLSKPPWEKEA